MKRFVGVPWGSEQKAKSKNERRKRTAVIHGLLEKDSVNEPVTEILSRLDVGLEPRVVPPVPVPRKTK